MRKRRTILVVLLSLFFVLAILAIVMGSLWNKPLGPGLGLSEQYSTPVPGSYASSTAVNLTGQNQVSNPESTPSLSVNSQGNTITVASQAPTRQPLCDGPATMTILAIGSDQRGAEYRYGLADSIHIIRIDFAIPNIMVIDFPRDLWVEIPGISDHYGITHAKLNQAYLFGNPGMGYYDGPGEGPGLLARTLELNFGLRVDHYVSVNMQSFVKVINAVGGVDIQVETPIDLNFGDAKPNPKYVFTVGTHHIDGELALDLALNRIPTTFQRMKYQKMILAALREKLLRQDMLPKLPKLVAQFITSVQTDLSLNDIDSLICIAKAVPKENIKADSFPQDMFTPSDIFDPYRKVDTYIYKADFDAIRAMLADFMNGIWPMP